MDNAFYFCGIVNVATSRNDLVARQNTTQATYVKLTRLTVQKELPLFQDGG
ncbi:MAG: hypothetical protein WAM14_05600 [Candidatus Nitrosopolaris sp.]